MFGYEPVIYTDEVRTCDRPGYASPLMTREAIPVHGFKYHTCASPDCRRPVYFNRGRDQWLHVDNDIARCAALNA